jgi:hypothetical protein
MVNFDNNSSDHEGGDFGPGGQGLRMEDLEQ